MKSLRHVWRALLPLTSLTLLLGCASSDFAEEEVGSVQQAICLSNALTRVTATASSVEGAFVATAAIDGSLGTRWGSAFSDPQWITVDLGASRHVNRVVLRWEAAASANYDVQIAPAETGPWTTLRTDTAGNGGVDDLTGLSGTGRYVRMYSRARTTGWGNSLWELEVYGDTNPSCATTGPVCGNGSVESPEQCDDGNTTSGDGCSSTCTTETTTEQKLTLTLATQSAGWVNPGQVIDNNTATATEKASTAVEWLEFNLPGNSTITRARVFEDNAGAWNIDQWNVQYWNGSAWTNAFALTASSLAGWNANDFPDVNTTRVRLQVQDNGHPEVMEFEVYGRPVSTGPVCGNGTLEGSEQCDDGNTANGDGCSSACQTESTGGGCERVALTVAGASASSQVAAGAPANAIDGNTASRWESVHGVDPQWFVADLGAARYIDDVEIEWEAASSANFDFEVSNFPDGPWTPALTNQSALGVPNHGVRSYSLNRGGRYVRLYSRARTTGYGVSFFEFKVFGDADAFCDNPCGNSVINAGETCDDGNRVTETCAYGATSCTVCNSSCQSVAGATSRCGDGIVDSLHEDCDDAGAAGGCPATCRFPAACNDLLRNQGETGIDCGGPCAACATSGLNSRPANPTTTGCVAPPPPQTSSFQLRRVFQGVSTPAPLTLKQEPGGTGRFYVVSKPGQIYVMPNDYNTTQRSLFIDINALEGVSNVNEDGMASMAFHPSYATNGYVYLTYIMAAPYQTRLARFTTRDGGATLDPTSKLVIRDEPITNNLHHSAQINFGPDGYLYMSVGDDGISNPESPQNWPNRVKGSIIRIDVDNPSGGRNYGIPAGNPTWPGATNPSPEVFATGFRNTWRFNFDRQTGRIFGGDVGGGAREEVNLITAGGNYGWPLIEGDPVALGQPCPNCNSFTNVKPIFNYAHGSPNQGAQGNAVIGGFVYRGTSMPGLNGEYVYGDFTGNEVWGLREGAGGVWTNRELVTAFNNNISSFGEDRNGELYVISLGGGSIWLLEPAGGQTGETFPALLSQTNCVTPGATLTPRAGVIPYTVAQAFWSDSAAKDRWLAIPDGTSITVDASGDWQLPPGGVLIKNFRAAGKNFETRFVVRHFNGAWSAYTYAWRADQTDATLVGPNPLALNPAVHPNIGMAWEYPGRSQCFSCHTSAAGTALGIETRQMNVNNLYPVTGRTANQLVTLTSIGIVSGSPASLDPFPNFDNANTSLQRRAEAYLHVNCSHCHRPGGTGQGQFNALFDVPFASKSLCNVEPSVSSLGIPDARLIAPGAVERSVLWERMSQREADFMPPLGSRVPDNAGAALLMQWIDGMSGCPSP